MIRYCCCLAAGTVLGILIIAGIGLAITQFIDCATDFRN